MAKKRAPHRKAVRVLQDWLDWAQEMHNWGRQVRADIVRLENACAKCSKVDFSKPARLIGPKSKRKGDPGDPPPPPET